MKNKCLKCGEKINFKKERYVDLSTFDGNKRIEQAFFHIKCWIIYFDEKTREKAERIVKGAMGKTMEVVKPLLKQMGVQDHYEIK